MRAVAYPVIPSLFFQAKLSLGEVNACLHLSLGVALVYYLAAMLSDLLTWRKIYKRERKTREGNRTREREIELACVRKTEIGTKFLESLEETKIFYFSKHWDVFHL